MSNAVRKNWKPAADHPWHKKLAVAYDKKRNPTAKRKSQGWECPNCGATDCLQSECVGGAY